LSHPLGDLEITYALHHKARVWRTDGRTELRLPGPR